MFDTLRRIRIFYLDVDEALEIGLKRCCESHHDRRIVLFLDESHDGETVVLGQRMYKGGQSQASLFISLLRDNDVCCRHVEESSILSPNIQHL